MTVDTDTAPALAVEHEQLSGRRFSLNVILAILAVGTSAFGLLQSVVVPALYAIQTELETTPTAAAWILTGYLLSASVATPILGRLGDMFGARRMMIITLLVLGLGTIVSALATSIGVMIAGRVVQGVGSAVFPLAVSIVRDTFPRKRAPQAIGLLAAGWGIGGAAGLLLAGPVVEKLGYPWLFWLPCIVIFLTAAATALVVPDSGSRAPGRVDYLGSLSLASWLICLLLAVSQVPRWGWASARTLGLFTAAAVLFAVWVRIETTVREPIIDLESVRIRGIFLGNLAGMCLGMGMFGASLLLPIFVQIPSGEGYGFGGSVTQAGLVFLPAAAGNLVTGVLTGRLAAIGGSRLPLAFGLGCTAVAFFIFTIAHDEIWQICVVTFIQGVGVGIGVGATATTVLEFAPSHQTGALVGLTAIVRTVGGAMGVAICASLLATSTTALGSPPEWTFVAAFAFLGVFALVGVVAALAMPRPRKAWLDAR